MTHPYRGHSAQAVGTRRANKLVHGNEYARGGPAKREEGGRVGAPKSPPTATSSPDRMNWAETPLQRKSMTEMMDDPFERQRASKSARDQMMKDPPDRAAGGKITAGAGSGLGRLQISRAQKGK